MKILLNASISPDRKRPFAHFLINVYLRTDSEDDHSEISILATDQSVHAFYFTNNKIHAAFNFSPQENVGVFGSHVNLDRKY